MHTLANDSDGTGRTNRSATACNSWNFAAILSVVLVGTLILNPPIKRVMHEPDLQLQECMLFDR